ncbi:MAG: hypothetical protein ACERLM_12815 [Acidimicrobiales bacterium]
MNRSTKILAMGSALAMMLTLVACGDDDDDSASDDGGGGDSVNVVLSEWIVEPDPTSAAAGSVEFLASNEGGETHELVIVKGDDADALPIDDTGKIQEDDLEEGTFIGEIEEFEAGTEASATFDLDAGNYLLFCNIVEEEDDGSFESHFLEGMVNTITVS